MGGIVQEYKLTLKYQTSSLTRELYIKPISQDVIDMFKLSWSLVDDVKTKNHILGRLAVSFLEDDPTDKDEFIKKLYIGHLVQIIKAGCEISNYKWDIF